MFFFNKQRVNAVGSVKDFRKGGRLFESIAEAFYFPSADDSHGDRDSVFLHY